jgi:hypothetical protein
MKLKAEHIKTKFSDCDIVSTDDLHRFYQIEEPDIKKTTVNWRIYQLVQNGILQRIGKGKFVVGTSIYYVPEISPIEKRINKIIQKEFPFIQYCIWNSAKLNEFLQHQISFQCTVVEVEKEVVESVYYALKDQFDQTFRKPSIGMVEEIISTQKNSIVIKTLISESPLQTIKNIPTSSLEKLLVDLYCDKNMFYFLHGNELVHVYQNAFEKYTINRSKLLRYANRRQKKIQIDELIESINRQ